ncbi:MAG: hypothetical protein A3H98_03210 [Bacteroidetes bacterium RIFCSPLOWO2_02_FULL_36_8]|nr:MAG: hypothetical protein A3H98_03210 [Bacteroidetes bacterium RIFCSPLOWO2_02_FULL_36_8]OFY70362.1 MAG: hypothetical protein A3G23_09540 [Bacteroidetes bacterium RIFCSPLOWO2_12_FULL_37_12]
MISNTLEEQILENLYFVEPYQKLKSEILVSEKELKSALEGLIKKKWVQAMKQDPVTHEYYNDLNFKSEETSAYFYLATKDGLLAHNSR